jgi:sugar O-acyltransferase (sialic acid O-acetyltransferase NeuD family)
MKKKLCIFGAGGFAKEVYWLAVQNGHDIDAFIDVHPGGNYRDTPVKDENYFNKEKHVAVVGIGNPAIRHRVTNQIISKHGEHVFQTLISHKAHVMDPKVSIGYGSVICANCIITCDVELGKFSQLNLATTIGHDTVTGDFFTTAPGVHVSGKVKTGERVYFGTNSCIIEGITICDDVTIGAGACVVKDITGSGIYVGTPAKKLEKK